MAQRLIWSPRASSHLEGICEYISDDSPMYARVFARKIISIVREIPAFPQKGRIVPEYNDCNLREIIYGDYRLIYRLSNQTIEIAAICHGARLLQNVINQH